MGIGSGDGVLHVGEGGGVQNKIESADKTGSSIVANHLLKFVFFSYFHGKLRCCLMIYKFL